MKYLNFIIFLIFINVSAFSQKGKMPMANQMKELPADILKSDVVILMTFYKNESDELKRKMTAQFRDSLLNYGYNIVYTYVPERIGDQSEISQLNEKYKPKYFIAFLSTVNGYGCGIATNGTSGEIPSSYSYMMKPTMEKLLGNMKSDIAKFKAKNKDADDNFKSAAGRTSVIKKEEYLQGPPSDLTTAKLAVLIFDYSIYDSLGRPKMKERYEKENAQIKEAMALYPYPYEILLPSEYAKRKEQFKYALMIDSEKKYKDVITKYMEVGTNKVNNIDVDRKMYMSYTLYIIESGVETDKLYFNGKWVSDTDLSNQDYDISRAYKKFVKYFSK